MAVRSVPKRVLDDMHTLWLELAQIIPVCEQHKANGDAVGCDTAAFCDIIMHGRERFLQIGATYFPEELASIADSMPGE